MAKGRVNPTKSVKHDGIKIDEKLSWIDYINDTVTAINFNAMLIKVRKFVNTKTLK